jgi:hypothetical protein
MNDQDYIEVPWQKEKGIKFLTGLQIAQNPSLAKFVENNKELFEVPHNRDIYIWKGRD